MKVPFSVDAAFESLFVLQLSWTDRAVDLLTSVGHLLSTPNYIRNPINLTVSLKIQVVITEALFC